MKKYAVRDYDKPSILKLKELETKEALEVEKERLRRERKLQDDLRQQRELEMDEERRTLLCQYFYFLNLLWSQKPLEGL